MLQVYINVDESYFLIQCGLSQVENNGFVLICNSFTVVHLNQNIEKLILS